MSCRRVLFAVGLVIPLCRFASSAVAEEISGPPSHEGLRIAGTALYATGAALVAVGTGAFIYGAVSNLQTMDCDTACGGVSAHFMRLSLAGAGIGLALAAVGGVILYNTRAPALVDKPGGEPRPSTAKAGTLSFALLPELHAPRAPIATMSLTF